MMTNLNQVNHRGQFMAQREALAKQLFDQPLFDRGEVHAQKITDPSMHTKELTYINAAYDVPTDMEEWQHTVGPNLPWAEDHFQERICGEPLNPPPSEAYWPFNRNQNREHKGEDEKFSHTYPERFWPVQAGYPYPDHAHSTHWGIIFPYGDLDTLISILEKNPRSRQAYLPIWFPEDLTAANRGERVPCTLGYHFMLEADGRLNMHYPMRSCDFLRFMVDDIYMAGRLLQHIASRIKVDTGILHMSISSLHVFQGDNAMLVRMFEDNDDYLGGVTA